MDIITPSRLTKARALQEDLLEPIARALPSPQKAAEFQAAISAYNSEIANALVEEAICTYSGKRNPFEGLTDFARRYDFSEDFSRMSDDDIILLIASHAAEVREKISARGG